MKEYELIEAYGLPKDELREFRKTLTEGTDWEREVVGSKPAKLCPVIFTEEGVRKALERFGVIQAKPADPDTKVFNATVFRCDFPNYKRMAVKLPDERIVFANVADARNFYAGAVVQITQKGTQFFCSQRPDSRIRLFNTRKSR
jgi:hypothetical protein